MARHNSPLIYTPCPHARQGGRSHVCSSRHVQVHDEQSFCVVAFWYTIPEVRWSILVSYVLADAIIPLSHVLVKRVPLDVGVLCNFMDHLCTLFVVTNRLKNQNTLHGITLPRTWLQRVAHDLPILFQRRMMPYYLYTGPMVDLLYQMFTGDYAGKYPNVSSSFYPIIPIPPRSPHVRESRPWNPWVADQKHLHCASVRPSSVA